MSTRLVVTGGCGFVGANIVRSFLRSGADREAVVLDLDEPDSLARDWFASEAARVDVRRADVCTDDLAEIVPRPEALTHIVHCATVTHVPEWERADPRRYLDVNLGGTVKVLEWARSLPRLRRLVLVSTGGVYGAPTPASPLDPQREDGPFNPVELYGVSKLAAEGVSLRYAELFGLDLRIARLSGIFGPMERATPGRRIMSPGHAISSAIVEHRELRVSRRSFGAAGDFLSAEDVAACVTRLLVEPAPRHRVYNVAFGTLTSVPELLAAAAAAAPELRYVATDERPEIDLDPENRRARWNAYDTTRAREDLGWRPRPLVEQFSSCLEWASRRPPDP